MFFVGIEVGVKPDGMNGSFSFTAEVYGRPCSRKREHSAYRESCCSQGLGSFQILPCSCSSWRFALGCFRFRVSSRLSMRTCSHIVWCILPRFVLPMISYASITILVKTSDTSSLASDFLTRKAVHSAHRRKCLSVLLKHLATVPL